tara:strand:- start:84 stop:608 length:525 start_codon:yes stop_codon:yes gene_type:complete
MDDSDDEDTSYFLLNTIRSGHLSIHDLSERHKKNPCLLWAALESVSQGREELKRDLSEAEQAAKDAAQKHANERAALIADHHGRVLQLERKLEDVQKYINTQDLDHIKSLQRQLNEANAAVIGSGARIAELETELADIKQNECKKRKRAPRRPSEDGSSSSIVSVGTTVFEIDD